MQMRKDLKYGIVGGIGGASITAIVLVALLAMGFIATSPSQLTVSQAGRAHGVVTVWVKRAGTDEWLLADKTSNLVATIGAQYVKDFLRNATTIYGNDNLINATDDIAVGNHTTPAITDTQLDDEANEVGVSRQSGTLTNINSTAYNSTYTWTATGDLVVNATSLHRDPTAATNNNMVFIASIAQVTLANNDQLQVTWEVQVNDG